jgi:hypothetical protein
MAYYSATKRAKLSMLAVTWVHLQGITLSQKGSPERLHAVDSIYITFSK